MLVALVGAPLKADQNQKEHILGNLNMYSIYIYILVST
jgi:hypothetical protein